MATKDKESRSGLEKLDSVTFDDLLEQQDPFGRGDYVFDLRGIRLITASALTQLAATAHAIHSNGHVPRIIIDDESVRSYLARVGFASVVGQVAQIEPPLPSSYVFDRLHGTNPMVIELTTVETGRELSQLLDRIVWTLRYRLKYRKANAFDVATAVSEIAQNSFDHNNGTAGFVAMQVYGRPDNRFLEIGVADCGDGILATLRRNPKHKSLESDVAAIREAIELGSSEHDDPTRGTGLYHLLEIAFDHRGSVQIRSDEGKVRYRMDKRTYWTFRVSRVPGVQVALTLPSKTRT